MALLSALVPFTHLLSGFRNCELTDLVGQLLDAPYSARQATYDRGQCEPGLQRFHQKPGRTALTVRLGVFVPSPSGAPS